MEINVWKQLVCTFLTKTGADMSYCAIGTEMRVRAKLLYSIFTKENIN